MSWSHESFDRPHVQSISLIAARSRLCGRGLESSCFAHFLFLILRRERGGCFVIVSGSPLSVLQWALATPMVLRPWSVTSPRQRAVEATRASQVEVLTYRGDARQTEEKVSTPEGRHRRRVAVLTEQVVSGRAGKAA